MNATLRRWRSPLLSLVLTGLLMLVGAYQAAAGPVDWHEVPASPEGRQWWDAGSLRVNRNGNLTVLSRFQPASAEEEQNEPDGRQRRPSASELYVMELDCDQNLYRDTSINGLPQWGSQWQAAGADGLIEATIRAACDAGTALSLRQA